MTAAALVFLIINAVALMALPRRRAALPLLVGACYMTLGQGIEIGPFSFPILRILALAGFIRVLVRGERPAGGMVGMDWLMVAWSVWALCASAFHKDPSTHVVGQSGLVYNTLGIYFLLRCFCQDFEGVTGLAKMTAILLVPVALEMVQEQLTGRNLFAVFGGVREFVTVRDGKLRSQGPFAHAILAGTIGAVCAPLMIGIWRRKPSVAKIGLAACLLMTITSTSSGPLMSFAFGCFALVLWRWRHFTRGMRIAAVVGYILLELVMKDPAYFIIARIDLTGSSTGWHRAELIRSSFRHLNEWWFAGTDYTRHWMATGVSWSRDHSDITNHYLQMGVIGGLPLMLLFVAIVWRGFRYVGEAIRLSADAPEEHRFLIWTLGASLFAHASTCISVNYFDQSFLFLYLCLAVICSLRSSLQSTTVSAPVEVEAIPCAQQPVKMPFAQAASGGA